MAVDREGERWGAVGSEKGGMCGERSLEPPVLNNCPTSESLEHRVLIMTPSTPWDSLSDLYHYHYHHHQYECVYVCFVCFQLV